MTFVKDPLNATTPREIIEYSQDLEDRVEDGFELQTAEINNLKPSFVPVNIIVGGTSTQTISPTSYGVRVNIKLGNNNYFSSAYIPRELFYDWHLLKDNSNNSILFRVASTNKIELWSGSAVGSAIKGFYEYK